jgi:hypothetical protein
MKKMIYGAVAALIMATTGCTGSFQLVQAVNNWHRNYENRWTDEICYICSVVFQIYSAAYIMDTIFLNSVEFWDGENAIRVAGAEASITRVNANTAIVQSNATGETYTLTRTADGTFAMTDMHGNTVTAEVQGSLLSMTLPDGTVRTTLM